MSHYKHQVEIEKQAVIASDNSKPSSKKATEDDVTEDEGQTLIRMLYEDCTMFSSHAVL